MLITVYEHSKINVGKERDEDISQISYDDREILLKQKLEDEKQNFYDKRYFQAKKIFEWDSYETIKTSSVVGTIKIDDDLTIEILPKIFNNNMDIKVARKNLIRLVEITEYEDIWDNESNIEEDAENIPYLEFIILRFTTNLLDELQKGIYAEYVTKIEESGFVRGAIQPHLQDIFDKSNIVCKFQELSFNNKLMQILKTISEHLLKNSMFSYEIKQNLFEITSILENVESLDKVEVFDFENYYFNRLNESYEILFYQAKIIYFEYFPLNSDEEETTPYWAIYFDMDFLFEKFVGHLLSKSGFDIKEQEKLQIYEKNYVTPDFILYNEEIVIDSKYSHYETEGKYKNPNSKNIFQITNYMDNLSFKGSLVMIGKSNENILYKNQMAGKSFNVITLDIGVDFENIIESFKFQINNEKQLDFTFDEDIFDEDKDNSLEKNILQASNELLTKANNYKKDKDWYHATKSYIKLFEESVLNKDKLYYSNNIGFCFYRNNDFNASKKAFEHSLKLKLNSYAYNFLGKIYFYEEKNYLNAIQNYTEAINLSEKNYEKIKTLSYYYQDRGYSYRNIRNYAKAISDFKKAIELNNDLLEKLTNEIKKLTNDI